jgi:hypothetical protein
LKHTVLKPLPWRATPVLNYKATNEHDTHKYEQEYQEGNGHMEQHLAEKEDYQCKDRNSEKNVKGEFSSVIAI